MLAPRPCCCPQVVGALSNPNEGNSNPFQFIQRVFSFARRERVQPVTPPRGEGSAAAGDGAAASTAVEEPAAAASQGGSAKKEDEVKSDEYTKDMQSKMGTSLTYRWGGRAGRLGVARLLLGAAAPRQTPPRALPPPCATQGQPGATHAGPLLACKPTRPPALPAGTRTASTGTRSCQTWWWGRACRCAAARQPRRRGRRTTAPQSC